MNIETIKFAMKCLEDILEEKNNRNEKVLNFISLVMQDETDKYGDYINELAYDMDYYDSDKNLQKKFGFYGDEKLEEIIKNALIVLKKYTDSKSV